MSSENSENSLPVKELNDQQKMFVAEYLTDFNATQAAIRAGYSEKTAYSQGPRLLAHVEVSRVLREAVKERAERLGIDANDILLRALKVYERSMQAEPVLRWNPDSMGMEETGEYVFDGKSATKALELIGKLLGAFMKDKGGEGDKRPFMIQINTAPRETQTIDSKPQPGNGLPVINLTVKETP